MHCEIYVPQLFFSVLNSSELSGGCLLQKDEKATDYLLSWKIFQLVYIQKLITLVGVGDGRWGRWGVIVICSESVNFSDNQ